jgi:carbon storage regulator
VLVVTRRRGDAIVIGDGIEVRILRVGPEGVRLGVVAPPDVPVHREEVYAEICEANRRAAIDPAELPHVAARLRGWRP